MLSIVSDDSKYDRYLTGTVQLTASEQRGRDLFFSDYDGTSPETSGADCFHCHAGTNFHHNFVYFNNGLDQDQEFVDFGRELVTGSTTDRAKFKTPTLRNIELTPPYMHDGRFETLEEVVEHYNTGIKYSATLAPRLQASMSTGLMLDEQDKIDLVNFLKTLTDHNFVNNTSYSDPY
jgi:cytochrome c peroxidase